MRKLAFLGVWMTPDVGETVSFLLDLKDDLKIVVDCGTNLVGSLIKNGIDPSEITHFIITHSHGDHISGLPTFLFYRLLVAPGIFGKKANKLQIIGTLSTINSVKDYVRAAYGTMVDNPLLDFVAINSADDYTIDSFTFNFFATKHQPETVGFCTSIDNKKLVYSADTGISEDLIARAENADILIHDVVGTSAYSMLSGGHTLCNEISPLLQKYQIKNFYPVHRLSIYNNNESDYINELQSAYSGQVIIPHDGDFISL